MVGIVIAGHGMFPEGVQSSTEMISGEIIQSKVVSLKPEDDPSSYGERLSNAIDEVDTGQGVLVVSDIRGGTPFNQSLMLCREKNIQIVVGINMPLMLVINVGRTDEMSLDELSSYVMSEAVDSIDLIKLDKEM